MPLRSRICPVGFAVESTSGTAQSVSASDATAIVYNAKIARNVDITARPGNVGFNQHTAVTGQRIGTFTCEQDFIGSGTDGVPPTWMTWATCCGMDLTGDVLACGTTTRTATIILYRDGLIEKLVGAAGTFVINGNSGGPARIAFTYTGKLVSDADLSAVSPTYGSTVAPRWAGGSCSVHSLSVKASTFSLDRGAEIIMREDPTDATGLICAHFVDATPTCTLDPETDLVATKNYQSIMEAHTEGALAITVGTAAGNTLAVASSTAQIVECPNDERNKMVVRSLKLQLNGTAAFSITHS